MRKVMKLRKNGEKMHIGINYGKSMPKGPTLMSSAFFPTGEGVCEGVELIMMIKDELLVDMNTTTR
jgi:hypothetical protein